MRQLQEKRSKFQTPILPPAFDFLWQPAPFKGAYGGRGAGKTRSFAAALITYAHKQRERILCTRQLQKTIRDSVHRVLCDTITDMNLEEYFRITANSIYGLVSGSEFLFKGLQYAPQEIKSTEGVTKVWMAEAQSARKESLRVLLPTIREAKSEIWAEWNTDSETDPIYELLVKNPPPGSIVHKINFDGNPYFSPYPADPSPLERQRLYALSLVQNARDDSERAQALADYDNIWLGMPRRLKQSAIFRSRVYFEEFTTPADAVFYHGLDFGYANDPCALTRAYEREQENGKKWLYIDREAFGWGVEIDDIGTKIIDKVDTAKTWKIYADCSRPESVSYLKRQGYNIASCDKWPGSVEDGIGFMLGYERIVVHQSNCPEMMKEAAQYSWKVDKQTEEILPVVVDAHNHGWDATRYGIGKLIKRRKRGFFDVD